MKETLTSGASPMFMPREDPVGKIVFAVTVLVFGLICFVALMTFLSAVLHRLTERSKGVVDQSPLRAILVGAVVYAVCGAVVAWLYPQAVIERLLETEIVPGLLGTLVVIAVIPLAGSLFGAPGTFSYVGDRLAMINGGDMPGLKRSALGTLVTVLAAWFPVIGWFLITPMLLTLSCGAFLLGQLRRWT